MAERLTLLPRPRGSLPEERKRGEKVDYTDWIAPQFLIDILEAAKLPGRAAAGEEIGVGEGVNFALNMAGGGLATSGGAPANALGAFSRGPNVGGIPIRELLFPGKSELTSAEKSAVTSFTKSLSNQAVRRREEMRAAGGDIVKPTPGTNLISEITLNPENLVGKRLVPVFGDLSGIGGDVSQIAGVPLSKAVTQQGGRKYSLLNPNVRQDIAYASEPGAAASKIANLNKYPDENVIGVFFGGSPDSINFSHHMAQSFVRQLDALKPSKEAINIFNKTIRDTAVEKAVAGSTKKVKTYPFKKFAGIDSPNIEELMTVKGAGFSPGQLRTAIADATNTAAMRDLGFPRYEDTLKVMTEKGLQPGYAGQTMFEAIPGRGIAQPDYIHQSYSAGIPGKYLGGLNINKPTTGVPADFLFPKLFAQQRAKGARDDRTLAKMRMSHQGEKFTEQDLEPLMRFLER